MKLTVDKKKRRILLDRLKKDSNNKSMKINSNGNIIGKYFNGRKWISFEMHPCCYSKEIERSDIFKDQFE